MSPIFLTPRISVITKGWKSAWQLRRGSLDLRGVEEDEEHDAGHAAEQVCHHICPRDVFCDGQSAERLWPRHCVGHRSVPVTSRG